MSAQKRIEEIKSQGYSLDFGEVFNQSFENFKQISLSAGIVFILLSIVFGAIAIGTMAAFIGLDSFAQDMTGFDPANFSMVGIIGYTVFAVVIAAIMAPLNAGILKMAYNAAHHLDVSVGTAFEYYQSKYFQDLFVAAAIITVISTGLSLIIQNLGFPFIGGFLNYVIAFFTFLVNPLIVFGEIKAIEAIKASAVIVAKQFFVILALLIVGGIMAMLGIFGFCIGIFFTIPFIFSLTYCIYDQAVGTDESSELDEIGMSAE